MNTIYKERILSPTHPATVLRERAFDVNNDKHPARSLIQKCIGTYDIQAIVEEDISTAVSMKQTKGLICFLCTLVDKNGRILAQGRGSTILNSTNKYIQRAISCAFNSAVADSVLRATRVLDTFRSPTDQEIDDAYRQKGIVEAREASKGITEKQEVYLKQLISQNIADKDAREEYLNQIPDLTKADASALIQGYSQ